jgi:ring-1,2-phenylacetyl-CoA epoxidase subunit PaaC
VIIKKAEEAKQNKDYKAALTELLYQLADDDFILAYRGSEWLGLAPHIEEDVAFSSINQDTMGHATIFYNLLEDLGEGKADDLAHMRPASERKNAIILEEVNGTGDYLNEPRYDWAFAVVRNYFYDLAKKIKLEALKNSSYEPLAHAAVKINMEQYYHVMHWSTWFKQLLSANEDAKNRMMAAVEKVWADFDNVLSFGPKAKEIAELNLIESEEMMKTRWISHMKSVFEELQIDYPGELGTKRGNGRVGEHTADLDEALKTLREVYETDTVTAW